MTRARQAVGRWGEQQAAAFLTERGFTLVAHNFRTPYGEIDLIARRASDGVEPPLLVFVEVKTRRSKRYGPPEAAVTPKKQAHLLAAISAFLQENPQYEAFDQRVDVIAVFSPAPTAESQITHFENAFTTTE